MKRKKSLLCGYACVYSQDEDLDLQIEALYQHGVKKKNIYSESVLVLEVDERLELQKCLDFLQAGDIFVVWRLDKLGLSFQELKNILLDLENRRISFRSIADAIDTTNCPKCSIVPFLDAFWAFGKNTKRVKLVSGLVVARKKGIQVGRKFKLSPRQQIKLVNMYREQIPVKEIMKHLKISKTCAYAYLRRHGVI